MELLSALDFEREPHSLKWALRFARGYLDLGMHSAAERELNRLSVRHRCYADVIELRIRVKLGRRQFEEAAWLARNAIKVYPGIAEFYHLAGTACEALNRLEEAREVWATAPPLFQVSGAFHYNLARYEALLGNRASARKHMARAIELDPAFHQQARKDPGLRKLLVDSSN